jgi:hypothetical protein
MPGVIVLDDDRLAVDLGAADFDGGSGGGERPIRTEAAKTGFNISPSTQRRAESVARGGAGWNRSQ